jgi:hypothetical protein
MLQYPVVGKSFDNDFGANAVNVAAGDANDGFYCRTHTKRKYKLSGQLSAVGIRRWPLLFSYMFLLSQFRLLHCKNAVSGRTL